jgi:hypothetical protein
VLPLTNPASHASANITEKNQSMVLTPTVLCFVYDCGKNVKICVTLECRIDLDERPEPVPFDLKNPFSMGKRVTGTAKGHGLEPWGHCIQH